MTPIDHRSTLKALVAAYERSLILDALEATGGHQRKTARQLGLLPTTLHEKMKRLGLLARAREESAFSLHAPGLTSEVGHQEGGPSLVSSY
jgi:DNA-binding NtrC family response regulator